MRNIVIAGVTALSLSLTGGAAGYAQTADSVQPSTASLGIPVLSVAATTYSPVPAVDEKKYEWTFEGEYVDASTGRSYYRAYTYDKQAGFMGRVIYQDDQGEWHALPDRYLNTYWDISSGRPMLVDGQDVSGLQRLSYDPSTNSVSRQTVFEKNKSGRFGLLQTKTMPLPHTVNGYMTASSRSLLMLKNFGSGEIREIGESEHSFFTAWLDDGSLLVERYSEEAKQNEIVKIDPSSGKAVRLLLASVWGYNKAGKKLAFAYDEPERRLWIYNLVDGTRHLASKQEIDAFYGSSSEAESSSSSASRPQEPTAAPPADLQPQLLPVTPTADTTVNEAEIAVNGTNAKLPLAFKSGGVTFLPVRPLADASLCKIEQTKSAGSSYFTLTGPSGSLKIGNEDSMMLGYRLYVSTEQLKSVGLIPERLTWTNRG